MASLVLTLFALSLTGGLASDLYPVLLLEIFVARTGKGPAAGRFLALAATAGVAFLAVPGLTAGAALTVGTVLRLAWPAAVLLVVESAGEPETPAGANAAAPAARPPAPSSAPEPAPPARDPGRALLHDLKSPLSVVRIYADLMTESIGRGESPRPEHLESLSNEISLMEAIVGVTRPAGPPPGTHPAPSRRTDLVTLLGTLTASYRDAHRKKLRIEFVADEESIPIVADPVAVQRALRNVLDNAVKYTPAGGQIMVRASRLAEHAFIVVSDTGIGMTREEQNHAFEYAWRGEAARASGAEGRGIGLAVVRELLEEQGGKISLLSQPGHGLEVTIMFPVPPERTS
jgi:two-component sensor histidine kinase